MTTNLILGATGAVGQFLLPKLTARGERIVAVSRSSRVDTTGASISWLRGDLFATMPTVPDADVVYSLGPLDGFSKWFAGVLDAGARAPRALIAFSSMSAQTKRDSVDPAEREIARCLHDAEARLLDAARRRGVACTILRPTLVYGSGRDLSLAPLARFARRWRVLPIPRNAGGLRQPVHADDLANACVGVRDVAAAAGRVYALGGGERLRFDTLLVRIAAAGPPAALAVRVPNFCLSLALRFGPSNSAGAGALSRLQRDLIADNAAASRDFGYAPRAFHAAEVLAPGTSACEVTG